MTRKEAEKIPELQIHPDSLVEDCFYYKMALVGRISNEHAIKASMRLQGHENDPSFQGSFIVADMMIANLDKYGVPCIDWCE